MKTFARYKLSVLLFDVKFGFVALHFKLSFLGNFVQATLEMS